MIDFRVFVVIFVASSQLQESVVAPKVYWGFFCAHTKYSDITHRASVVMAFAALLEDLTAGRVVSLFLLPSIVKKSKSCLPKDSRNWQATPGTFPSDQQPGPLMPSFTKSLRSPFTGLWRQSAFSSSKSLNSSRHIPTTPNSTRPETVLNTCIYLKKYAHG